jgi:hypothetical protein
VLSWEEERSRRSIQEMARLLLEWLHFSMQDFGVESRFIG